MNWSTRLRRWVRIRMPPVREASMKPTAATVLPAPVACSNQKRRLAPGSSGASSTTSSSSSSPSPRPPPPRWPPLSSFLLLDGLLRASRRRRRSRRAPRPWRRRGRGAAVAVARPGVAVEALLDVGDQRGERARERVDLVGVELGAVGEVRLLLGEQPLEAEHEREVAAPLDRRRLAALVDLGERGVQRPAPRGAGGEVLRLLALEQERLAGELACSLDVGARRRLCRFGGRLGVFSQSEALLIRRSSPLEKMARRNVA